ncbi:hypothetical protein ACNS7O_11485 [Haloferacaceae archaeon DSL9]
MGLSTADIMQLSLDLVGWDETPADSTVYVPGEDIETALVGIDLESPEVRLAHEHGYDLALAHHPVGDAARLEFPAVLDAQIDFMTAHGVPEPVAEDAVADLRARVEHGAHSSNYRHDPSVAELLGQPYMNVHLATDEIGRRAFVDAIESLPADATVADLETAFLEEFAAFRDAATDIETRLGRDDNPLGAVAVHHAAGTNGGADVARAYFDHGVDTVLYIHIGHGDTETLREEFGDDKNLVVTGHIASDAVGLNVFIDALEDAGVDCTCISGCGLGRD